MSRTYVSRASSSRTGLITIGIIAFYISGGMNEKA